MIDVSIGIEGSEAFKRKLMISITELQNLKPIFDDVVKPYMQAHMKKQFQTSGQYGGSKWAGNSKAYNRVKRLTVGHTRILERSGKLKRSLIGTTIASKYISSRTSMTYGTTIPYAKYQNNGTSKGIKAKQIFGMTNGQKKALVTLIQRELLMQYK